MNDRCRLIVLYAFVTILALTIPADADCPSLPVPRGGTVARGETKASIARAILDELARRLRTSGSADVQTSFLSSIDYTAYLTTVSFKNDTDITERLRQTLNERVPQLGDRLLLLVADAYYRDYPANLYKTRRYDPYAWLWSKTGIGVFYIDQVAKKYGAANERTRALYELIGTYTLFQVASHIDIELASKRLDATKLSQTLTVLRDHGVPVGTPKGDLSKGWDYFIRGDLDKLLQRVLDRTFVDHYKRLVGDTYSAGPVSASCSIQSVEIRGQRLGSVATAYLMNRRSVYVTYRARAAKGQALAVPYGTLLAMSASYTDSDGIPDGFTVLHGEVRNAGLSRRMDALVAIDQGNIDVVDLRSGARCGQKTLQPFSSLPDYYCLLDCATNAQSTIFQTHLLYAEGRPAFDPATAPVKPTGKVSRRERRILAITADRFIVIDIPAPCTIAEGTFLLQQTLRLLSINTAEVRAAINLDTGSFDIFDVFCPLGKLRQSKKLRTADASNLLVFTAR
jgi:hypothetical protein